MTPEKECERHAADMIVVCERAGIIVRNNLLWNWDGAAFHKALLPTIHTDIAYANCACKGVKGVRRLDKKPMGSRIPTSTKNAQSR